MNKELLAILASDSYKQSHKQQYRKGTEVIYSTWTPRKSRIPNINEVVTFGIQYFIKDYLIDSFNKTFYRLFIFIKFINSFHHITYRTI